MIGNFLLLNIELPRNKHVNIFLFPLFFIYNPKFMEVKTKCLFPAAAPPKAELDSKLVGETVTVTAGSDLVLDGAVGGKPEPTVYWSKGEKILDLGEKYSLTYTATKAMAVIKNCDRYDSGKYILTVKNASGVKTATVNVKVLGQYARHDINAEIVSLGQKLRLSCVDS